MKRRGGGRPHPVDLHVGKRLKQRRALLGLSQQTLGDHLGLSFQQVQKYENGANRISASRLYLLAQILNVPVGYFFEGLPACSELTPISDMRPDLLPAGSCANCGCGMEAGSEPSRETLKLVGAYHRIQRPSLRLKLLALVRDLGKQDIERPPDLPRPR